VRSCVIIVENLPVPLDRRVWQEARALRDAGWRVSVICPTSKIHSAHFEELEKIAVYRHDLPLEARGKLGFFREYLSALLSEARLLFKIATGPGFDVIQVCNPPDILFLNALPYKLLGKRLVFDHHDTCPELFAAKFGTRGFFYRLLLLAEKATMKTADIVICANDTYRDLAITRGGRRPEDVTAVYSVPRLDSLKRVAPNSKLRNGARIVLGYVGIISDQDGVDQLVLMMQHLIEDFGRGDIHAIVIGDGPALQSVRELAIRLGLAERITFTGYLSGEDLHAAMSSFDIGIIPDPINEYNDKISMNKVFEYSALGVPTVAYDLSETRRLLGATAQYSEEPTPRGLARACLKLIEDDAERSARGQAAKTLADDRFVWENEARKYVAAYEKLMARSGK